MVPKEAKQLVLSSYYDFDGRAVGSSPCSPYWTDSLSDCFLKMNNGLFNISLCVQ